MATQLYSSEKMAVHSGWHRAVRSVSKGPEAISRMTTLHSGVANTSNLQNFLGRNCEGTAAKPSLCKHPCAFSLGGFDFWEPEFHGLV